MKGKILNYSIQDGKGLISSIEGERYTFLNSEWMSMEHPQRGLNVDFICEDGIAKSIYIDEKIVNSTTAEVTVIQPQQESSTYERKTIQRKSRLIYIVLALFLGFFGVHNFYAGFSAKASSQLILNIIAIMLFVLLGWIIIGYIFAFPIWLILFVWVIIDVCTVDKDSLGNYFE